MTHAPLTRALVAVLVIVFIAPAAFMVATPPVQACTPSTPCNTTVADTSATNVGDFLEDTISAIKNAASYLLDITNTAADYAKYIKAYILDPIAFIVGGNLLKSITSSILNFVNKNKLYVQNLPGYLQNVGDVQAYAFLNQFSSQSNSPFAAAITSSLRANYLQETTMAGFFAANRNTLSRSSPNFKRFLAGDWSQGGASAWFALTTQDQNNPYILYYRAQDQMTRSVQNMTAAKLAQLNWGRGFLSWCGSGVNTTSSSGADSSGQYGTGTTGTGSDTQESILSCPGDSDITGDGCSCDAKLNPNGCGTDWKGNDIAAGSYALPDNWSCPTGSTWDSSYGGCSVSTIGETDIIPPLDENGNPAVTVGTAKDFYGSGDAYNGKPDTTTVSDGTVKFSKTGHDLSAATDLAQLDDILTEASKSLSSGCSAGVTPHGGKRNGSGGSAHDVGSAIDIAITCDGVELPNRGDASTKGEYLTLAVAAYNANQELGGSCKLGWGGCFDTSLGYRNGEADGMHFDCRGDRGYRCSGGLAGLAAKKTSLAPQSTHATTIAVATPAKKKSGSIVGNALGYVWNLTPTATATYGDNPSADVAADIAADPTGTGVTSSSGTGSSVTRIPQPGDPCTKKDGTQGRIQTPGSVIQDFLSKVLGLNVQKATMIGDIGASINGILNNVSTILKTVDMAAGLFGAPGGLGSVSGTSSYTSPFADYLNSSSYMGLKTSDIKDTGKVVNNLDAAAKVNESTFIYPSVLWSSKTRQTSVSTKTFTTTTTCGYLATSASLAPGKSITSCNGRYLLSFQTDGNVSLYDNDSGSSLWSTGTGGSAATTLTMQDDGNLVLYDANAAVLWADNDHGGTIGTAGWLAVQDDGNLVVYNTIDKAAPTSSP